MTARCTSCSKCIRFRNTRGARLSDQRCSCGGNLEIVGGDHTIAGPHPTDSDLTHVSKSYVSPYYYAYANRKKEYFYLHDGVFHKIDNPVFADYIPLNKQQL